MHWGLLWRYRLCWALRGYLIASGAHYQQSGTLAQSPLRSMGKTSLSIICNRRVEAPMLMWVPFTLGTYLTPISCTFEDGAVLRSSRTRMWPYCSGGRAPVTSIWSKAFRASRRSSRTYRFQHGVYNTFDSLRIEHTSEPVLEEMPIPCTPLQDVIDAHFPNRHIDLLSIDCEGQDLTVLQSIDWHRTRPTAVIVEDHEQFESNLCSGTPSQIRSLLTKRDYGLFTQCMYSFLYVDRRAFLRPNGETGFLLEKTQFHGDMRELAEKTSA